MGAIGLCFFSNAGKGKDALSGIIFSVVFVLYGSWELFRLVNERK